MNDDATMEEEDEIPTDDGLVLLTGAGHASGPWLPEEEESLTETPS